MNNERSEQQSFLKPGLNVLFEIISDILPGYELTQVNKMYIHELYGKYSFEEFNRALEDNKRNILLEPNRTVNAANAERFIYNLKGYLNQLRRPPIEKEKAWLLGTIRRRFARNSQEAWQEMYTFCLPSMNKYIDVLREHGRTDNEIIVVLKKQFYDMTCKAPNFSEFMENIEELINTIENPTAPITFNV